jgi:AraC family transcriptional regulator of adaptative response / DNA-3-methyladenine glycosylase II
VDGFELAVRAIVGQQVSVAGARTVLGRIVNEYGTNAFDGMDWRLFPTPADLADLDPAELPMPTSRGRAITAVARAMAGGELELHAGADREASRNALLAIRGVGPWTADYLLMRAIGDPDIYLDTDLGIRHALARLPAFDANGCAPWRSYLSHHLWAFDH